MFAPAVSHDSGKLTDLSAAHFAKADAPICATLSGSLMLLSVGQFANAMYLIDKYGIVPQEIMPDTPDAYDSETLRATLRTLLRSYGLRLRESSEPEALRSEALGEVYKVLQAALGTPPENFKWEGELYTPLQYRDALGLAGFGSRYALLMNDPTRPYHKMYRVEGSRGAYDAPDWTFLNLPMEELEAIGIKSLAAGERFYFTADTDAYSDKPAGVYSLDTYDIPSLTKEELFRSYGAVSAHAMAMCGVKIADDGTPERWVAQNSFGLKRGPDGLAVMDREWWQTYMFRMVVKTENLTPQQQTMRELTPETIPYWNLY